MESYIKICCPNRPKENKRSCGHILGGMNKDLTGSEIRYCSSCNLFWEVKRDGGTLSFKALEGVLDLIPAEEELIISISGGRSK